MPQDNAKAEAGRLTVCAHVAERGGRVRQAELDRVEAGLRLHLVLAADLGDAAKITCKRSENRKNHVRKRAVAVARRMEHWALRQGDVATPWSAAVPRRGRGTAAGKPSTRSRSAMPLSRVAEARARVALRRGHRQPRVAIRSWQPVANGRRRTPRKARAAKAAAMPAARRPASRTRLVGEAARRRTEGASAHPGMRTTKTCQKFLQTATRLQWTRRHQPQS